MQLNDAGKMIETVWNEIPHYYNGIGINTMCIMPDHFHGIVIIQAVGAGPRACPNNKTMQSNNNNGNPKNNNGNPKNDNGNPYHNIQFPENTGHPVNNNGHRGTDTGHPRGGAPTVPLSLPDVVHRFKSMTTKRYIDGVKKSNWQPFDKKIWQRNYWDHIIRNKNELIRIQKYINNNPFEWETDKLNGGLKNEVYENTKRYGVTL